MQALQIRSIETEVAPAQPAFNKPDWWDNPYLSSTYENKLRAVVKSFLTGELKGHAVRRQKDVGNFNHIYSTRKNGTELWLHKDNPANKISVCIARKINGAFIGNASSIAVMRSAKGKLSWIPHQQKIQEVLAEVMPMVPFRMFKEAQLDLDTFKIVDRGPEEKLDLDRVRNGKKTLTHFMGAMLFKLEVRAVSRGAQGAEGELKDKYFLFDIDRNDLALKHFNAFLSRLAAPANSIAEAYDSLKPQEVRDAERFLPEKCPRQGEWFFIPVAGEFFQKMEFSRRGVSGKAEAVLQSKGNRAHHVKQLSPEGYVRGAVWHGGGEHQTIGLKNWHKPVPNTAVESFKISGAID